MVIWNGGSRQFKDKRKGPDLLIYWVKISSVIAWILIGVYLLIADQARPEQEYFLDRLLDVHRNPNWNDSLLVTAFIIAIIIFFFSLLSLIVNSQRLKRKDDHLSFSLITALVISSIGIVLYFVYYLNNIL